MGPAMKVLALASIVLALLAAQAASGAPAGEPCHEQYNGSAADRLPDVIDAPDDAHPLIPLGKWTLESIVEVRRITDVALSQQAETVAFIAKQSFVDSGAIRYALYAIELGESRAARKLAESPYMHGLASRPGTAAWT